MKGVFMATNRRDIIRLLLEGVSQNDVCSALHCSKRTVSGCAKAIKEHDINQEMLADLAEDDIRQLFFAAPDARRDIYVEPDFEYVLSELSKPGVTRKLLWHEYSNTTTDGTKKLYQYAQFCERLTAWAAHTKATMRLDHRPAHVCHVDWAGDTLSICDRITGVTDKAYFFVACLPYSGYLFAHAYADTCQRSWLDGHRRAFEFFGGVPTVLVPDNCKTAIDRANIYLTEINATYYEFAEHYGCAIVPARVRRPRDKAAVEGGVNLIERWILAPLRNETFFSLGELDEAVESLLDALNERPFQQRTGSRRSIFTADEQDLLKALPSHRFEICEWRVAKIGHNYHARVDKQNYSVDYHLIGKKLDVRLSDSQIRLYNDGELIASHPRLYGRMGQYSTIEEHMPPNHRYHLSSYSPERFERWAASIGVNTAAVIDRVLASHVIVEQAFVPAANILGLAKGGRAELLERACERIVELGNIGSYTQIKNIMAAMKKTDDVAKGIPVEAVSDGIGNTGRTRGADYYRRGGVGNGQ